MKHAWRMGAAAIAVAGFCMGPAFAAPKGDPAAGRVKADTCMGCHGIPTYDSLYPAYHVPKLGGQHAQYIINALKDYRKGKRHYPTMNAQASSLSDQDIADIAAFLSQAPAE